MLNSNYFSSNFKLAIIGGGQLGKMLLTETLKMDIYTMVLDISKDAPSRLACNEFVVGDLMDYDTVYRFGTKADLITIEIEHINVDALEKLEQEGKIVHPKPAVLRNIQDKGLQKLLYREKGIYSAPFTIYDSKEQYINDIKCETSTLPAVWKSRKFGYDGKGVAILRTISKTLFHYLGK